MNLAWSHVLINVADLPKMVGFYTQVLGFEVRDHTESVAFLSQQEDEHHQIALSAVDELSDTGSRINHCAFRLGSFSELMDLYQRLKVDGDYYRVKPITHGNTWSIYFNDPEGNGLEVFCDTPWEIPQPYAEPWDPQLSFNELYRITKERIQDLPGFGPNSRMAQVD